MLSDNDPLKQLSFFVESFKCFFLFGKESDRFYVGRNDLWLLIVHYLNRWQWIFTDVANRLEIKRFLESSEGIKEELSISLSIYYSAVVMSK